MVVASLNALSSTHIKRILAYSTVEDMGLIFIALGFNSIPAAVLLFVFQTFYKGLIFMDAGILTRANRDEMDIRRIAGSRRMSVMLPTLIAVASLAGIFPLGGFFGKVAVEAAVQNYLVYAALLAVEVVSSMYIFRWLFVPLKNSPEKGDRVPRAALHVGRCLYPLLRRHRLCSCLDIPVARLKGPAVTHMEGAIYTVAVLAGLALSYLFYYRRLAPDAKIRSFLSRICDIEMAINAFYRFVVWFVRSAGTLADAFDHSLYATVKGSGYGAGRISLALERTENGSMNYYLAVFVSGR